jgi:hypothetical protein
MYVLTLEHIALVNDVVALSKPNRYVRLAANRLCGSSADGGECARGTLPPDAVTWLS